VEHHTRRRAVALVALVLLPTLAACGPTDSDGSGHLSGTVATEGGMHATVRSAEAKVTASPTSGDTSATYTAETTGHGSFTLDLPPGTYEISGTLTGTNAGGQLTSQQVTIDEGTTTKVKLFALYP